MKKIIFAAMSMCIFCSGAFAISEDDLRNAAIEANQLCNQRTLYPQDQRRNCNMAKSNYYAMVSEANQEGINQHDAELRKSILREVQEQKDKESIWGRLKNLWHGQDK